MLEMLANGSAPASANVIDFGARPVHGYHGPERRHRDGPHLNWLTAAFDEIDYGVIVIGGDGQALYLNHAARVELDGEHPLLLAGQHMRAHAERDTASLQAAIDDAARRGLRRLLHLGGADDPVCISVVPLNLPRGLDGAHAAGELRRTTLLLLGRRRVGGELVIGAYARHQGLSPAETRVLHALCDGLRPHEVAEQHGVAISTVRTQIGNIRAKTGTASIRALVRRVATLPPLVPMLHRSQPR
jgi:DNA-binding CsgD family transcriptional regulator